MLVATWRATWSTAAGAAAVGDCFDGRVSRPDRAKSSRIEVLGLRT